MGAREEGVEKGREAGVMGLILAERIIKRYYHNGSVIRLARTQRRQPSHVCLAENREEGTREVGRRRGWEGGRVCVGGTD